MRNKDFVPQCIAFDSAPCDLFSMQKTQKTAPMSFRLNPDVKAKLQRLAERENRSLTNYIETKLMEIAEKECHAGQQ